MTAQLTLTEKATTYAREVSENGSVFVYENNGVYWLAVRVADTGARRTLMAVGFEGCGIRRIRKEIATYFGGK
jgi:hypothetical protein